MAIKRKAKDKERRAENCLSDTCAGRRRGSFRDFSLRFPADRARGPGRVARMPGRGWSAALAAEVAHAVDDSVPAGHSSTIEPPRGCFVTR